MLGPHRLAGPPHCGVCGVSSYTPLRQSQVQTVRSWCGQASEPGWLKARQYVCHGIRRGRGLVVRKLDLHFGWRFWFDSGPFRRSVPGARSPLACGE